MLKQIRGWLFEPLPEPRTASSIIRWWESRRLYYNVLVGTIGFCSFLAFLFFIIQSNVLQPGEDAEEPLALIFAWIPINLCYTAGWVLEIAALYIRLPGRYFHGPALMRVGIGFSVFVLLLPSVIWGAISAEHAIAPSDTSAASSLAYKMQYA